jgi:ubiquinone/menaquinone biosynthesis C-methylase UbiE
MVVYKSHRASRDVKAKYDRIYKKAGKSMLKIQLPRNPLLMALERLDKDKQLRALDIGCGDGADSILLSKKGVQVAGIDISRYGIARARRFAMNVRPRPVFIVGNFLKLKIDEKFDIVILNFVLHHFKERYKKMAIEKAMKCTDIKGINVIAFHTKLYTKKYANAPEKNIAKDVEGFQTELRRFYIKKRWKIIGNKRGFSGKNFANKPIHWEYIIAQKIA